MALPMTSPSGNGGAAPGMVLGAAGKVTPVRDEFGLEDGSGQEKNRAHFRCTFWMAKTMTTKETLIPQAGESSVIDPPEPVAKPARRPRVRQPVMNTPGEGLVPFSPEGVQSNLAPAVFSKPDDSQNTASVDRPPRRSKKASMAVTSEVLPLASTETICQPAPQALALTKLEISESDGLFDVDDTIDEQEPQMENRAPRPEPVDVEEVFSQVVLGEFDVGSTELPPLPAKRVLLPDPEAPKLQKVLAQAGVGSRRDMEQMIADGQITVNGHPAHVGQRISLGDQISVGGKPIRFSIVPPSPRILAYHKPAGEVVTHDDPQQRPTVFRRLPRLAKGKWQSVGRLDLNTEGLLLFTNSGDLANQLMHPRFGVEREYAVRVLGTLEPEAKAKLLAGVQIDGQMASFKSVDEGGGEGVNRWYRVVITEGRYREVRKLFDAVGLTVSRLIRIRYGTVVLPRGLKRGMWVDLSTQDVQLIRQLAGPRPPRKEREGRDSKEARSSGRNPRHPKPQGFDAKGRLPDRGYDRSPSRQAPRQHGQQDVDDDFDPRDIPNPLEQTFDKRFVSKPRSPAGGRGFQYGGGGFGSGGSGPVPSHKKGGPREPDPLQTSVAYIGAEAFHRKVRSGGKGGGGHFGGGKRGR